jgi:hypothetical protein
MFVADLLMKTKDITFEKEIEELDEKITVLRAKLADYKQNQIDDSMEVKSFPTTSTECSWKMSSSSSSSNGSSNSSSSSSSSSSISDSPGKLEIDENSSQDLENAIPDSVATPNKPNSPQAVNPPEVKKQHDILASAVNDLNINGSFCFEDENLAEALLNTETIEVEMASSPCMKVVPSASHIEMDFEPDYEPMNYEPEEPEDDD